MKEWVLAPPVFHFPQQMALVGGQVTQHRSQVENLLTGRKSQTKDFCFMDLRAKKVGTTRGLKVETYQVKYPYPLTCS